MPGSVHNGAGCIVRSMVSDSHHRAQNAALRRLTAYRIAASDLTDAVREADGQEVEVAVIAREAGISRNRVYRILGRLPSRTMAAPGGSDHP